MQQQNIAYDLFLLKDAGYDAPGNMIGVNEKFLKDNADIMPAFVKGIQDGKAIADPAPLFREIQKRSATTTDAQINYSWGAAKAVMNTPYQLEKGFGMTDPTQMSGLFAALDGLGLFKTKMKVEDTYTNQFVSSQVLKTA